MRKSILITGGSGLLAVNWAILRRDDFDIIHAINQRQISLQGTVSQVLALESIAATRNKLEKIRPHFVIHTAGVTSVEVCEAQPDHAYKVNVELAKNLAIVCNEMSIPLIHISTDHLFDGSSSFVTESVIPTPLNRYAETKAMAENEVLETHPGSLVIRTNFYGWGTSYRQSFSDIIIKSLVDEKSLTLFDDVFFTPVLAEVLIDVIEQLLDTGKSGVYNVASDDRISKYEFGLKLADAFELNDSLIARGKLSDQTHLVKRPFDMSLSNKKVSGELNFKIGNTDEHIRRLVAQQQAGLARELGEL